MNADLCFFSSCQELTAMNADLCTAMNADLCFASFHLASNLQL
jgi:hypothetical protein